MLVMLFIEKFNTNFTYLCNKFYVANIIFTLRGLGYSIIQCYREWSKYTIIDLIERPFRKVVWFTKESCYNLVLNVNDE